MYKILLALSVLMFVNAKSSKPKELSCFVSKKVKKVYKWFYYKNKEIQVLKANLYSSLVEGNGLLELVTERPNKYLESICAPGFNLLKRHVNLENSNLQMYFSKTKPGAYNSLTAFVCQLISASDAKLKAKTAFIDLEVCGNGSLMPTSMSKERFAKACAEAYTHGNKVLCVSKERFGLVPRDIPAKVVILEHVKDLEKVLVQSPIKDFESKSATGILVGENPSRLSLVNVSIVPGSGQFICGNCRKIDGRLVCNLLTMNLKLAKDFWEKHDVIIQSSKYCRVSSFGLYCIMTAALSGKNVKPIPIGGRLSLDEADRVANVRSPMTDAVKAGFKTVMLPRENAEDVEGANLIISSIKHVDRVISSKKQVYDISKVINRD
jgi:hypothetical protein